jgi:hypothetical protein
MGPPTLVTALIVAGLVVTIAVVVALLVAIVWLVVKVIGCIVALFGAAFAGSILAILVLVLVIAALALLAWFVFVTHRLPLWLIGLGTLTSLPAIPFRLSELLGTVLMLAARRKQTGQAMNGLSVPFTVGGRTAESYVFMFGTSTDKSWTKLSLDLAEQFSMAWTTFNDVWSDSNPLLPGLADTLRSKETATKEFWPMIARHGLSYNLIILENVGATRAEGLRSVLGAAWSDEMAALQAAGNLYLIDMTLFASLPITTANGSSRFTPATMTFLKREGGAIVPFWIRVAGQDGATAQQFVPSDPAWLYALQAAKTSITVWGIWIGHVWHWHIVTAAMILTMFQTLGARHIVRQLLGYQSDYLIGFDQVLLLNWSIAPPTSIASSRQFLRMLDRFATGRTFFADDPKTTLTRLGLRKEDFTKSAAWDEYPVVRYLLSIWDASERYVGAVIDAGYASDEQVKSDTALQAWIAASGDPAQGNIAGLPPLETKAALKAVMTSLIFRITAHGASRLNQAANPYLTYVADFPPCLQNADIPRPNTVMDEKQLLAYLPNTGTIGALANFLFTFAFSTPYVPFIPLDGIEADLPFTGPSAHACNDALIAFRRDLEQFIDLWARDSSIPGIPAQVHRWPLNIET